MGSRNEKQVKLEKKTQYKTSQASASLQLDHLLSLFNTVDRACKSFITEYLHEDEI